jgi:hypothetical protein
MRAVELKPGYELRSVGFGPSATGGIGGWAMSDALYARCPQCGDFMSLGHVEVETCSCGTLFKDVARFGSRLGDDSIEIFRAVPTRGDS